MIEKLQNWRNAGVIFVRILRLLGVLNLCEPFVLSDNEKVLTIKHWDQSHVIAGFTTRNGGVSQKLFRSLNMGYHVRDKKDAVDTNYSIVENIISIPLNNWISSKQVHSTSILEVDEHFLLHNQPPPNFDVEFDGFITNQQNCLLTAVFADCVPLYFYSEKDQWIGLAHAGWKGTVNGIGRKMVEALVKKGVSKRNIQVVIGPSISATHYEVDLNVVKHIPLSFHSSTLTKVDATHYLLDLKQLNKEMLLHAGIHEEQINVTDYCSFQDKELFFSHRRDNGETGRMMAFIGLERSK